MAFVLPLLMALAALAGGDVDTVTPGPSASSTAASGSGAPHVTVIADRQQLTLGNDDGVGLTFEVSGFSPGANVIVRGVANVGRVDPPKPGSAPGRFVSRYLTPQEQFPQVAVIVVEARAGEQSARGVIRLPLCAPTEMPFRTDPHAQVTLRVGDRLFGPTSADAGGKVKLPIIVPPGVGIGQARAVDGNGNLSETIVDLQPTAYPRAVIVAPPALVVGTLVELSVYATEPRGEPTPTKLIALRPSRGVAHALEPGPGGEARFLYEAPSGVDVITFEASKSGDPAASFQLTTNLHAGPAKKLTLTPSTNWLVIGSGQDARVGVAAEDRFGNPVACNAVTLTSAGQKLSVDVSQTGDVSALVRAPERFGGKDAITVEAALEDAHDSVEILLSGGPPAHLTVDLATPSVVADGRRGVEVRVNAVDQAGAPTMISGMSWEISGGRLSNVRKPRVGTTIANFVPRRASTPHDETIAVMASQALRASATVRIEPPPPRAVVTARAAFFSNLGSASGPAAFLDAVRPLAGKWAAVDVGLSLGYLHDDITTRSAPAVNAQGTRVEIDQFPLLAIGRYRLPIAGADVHARAGIGASLASTRLTPPAADGAPPVTAPAQALALEIGGEAAFPLAPGQLIVGLRYLWIEFGHTSHHDEIGGNSAGLVADLGYRLSF
ncbi:MAG TPA: hypothetical protein VH374_16290 [Polyangia bacterium]|jgi:hypothetical protein|nr:hypothetical protein [Polyangia bacterium]